MQWQIDPYMQDVQEKFIEKAAAAEAKAAAPKKPRKPARAISATSRVVAIPLAIAPAT